MDYKIYSGSSESLAQVRALAQRGQPLHSLKREKSRDLDNFFVEPWEASEVIFLTASMGRFSSFRDLFTHGFRSGAISEVRSGVVKIRALDKENSPVYEAQEWFVNGQGVPITLPGMQAEAEAYAEEIVSKHKKITAVVDYPKRGFREHEMAVYWHLNGGFDFVRRSVEDLADLSHGQRI